MKTDLTKTTRSRFSHHVALLGAVLLTTFLAIRPARAQSGLVVKFYGCPRDQPQLRSTTWERIRRNRRRADCLLYEPNAELIKSKPRRKSRPAWPSGLPQRFPRSRKLRRPWRAGSRFARFTSREQIQPDQFEKGCCGTTWGPVSTPYRSSGFNRGYRLALSNGGTVAFWIDLGAKQVKLEGPAAAVDAAGRVDPGPGCAARPGGRDRPRDASETVRSGQRPPGGFPDSNRQRRAAAQFASGGPAHATAARGPGRGQSSSSPAAARHLGPQRTAGKFQWFLVAIRFRHASRRLYADREPSASGSDPGSRRGHLAWQPRRRATDDGFPAFVETFSAQPNRRSTSCC